MEMNLHMIQGCDGTFCENADTQMAFPLDDMPNVAFCRVCWGQEMQRRRRMKDGNVLPFPGEEVSPNPHTPHLHYPGFDGAKARFEKIRRAGRLED
jgi:hypothetical protein